MVTVLRWVVALPLLLGMEAALVLFTCELLFDDQVAMWALVVAMTQGLLGGTALATAYLLNTPA